MQNPQIIRVTQNLITLINVMYDCCVQDLLVELGLYFVYDMKEAITALMVPNDHFYAYELHHAIEGFGTDEDAISEILGSLNNTEILNISAIYENGKKIQHVYFISSTLM